MARLSTRFFAAPPLGVPQQSNRILFQRCALERMASHSADQKASTNLWLTSPSPRKTPLAR